MAWFFVCWLSGLLSRPACLQKPAVLEMFRYRQQPSCNDGAKYIDIRPWEQQAADIDDDRGENKIENVVYPQSSAF
jgi:hypothetical protein